MDTLPSFHSRPSVDIIIYLILLAECCLITKRMITIVVSLLRSGERWQIEKPSVQTVIQNAGKRYWPQKTLRKSLF